MSLSNFKEYRWCCHTVQAEASWLVLCPWTLWLGLLSQCPSAATPQAPGKRNMIGPAFLPQLLYVSVPPLYCNVTAYVLPCTAERGTFPCLPCCMTSLCSRPCIAQCTACCTSCPTCTACPGRCTACQGGGRTTAPDSRGARNVLQGSTGAVGAVQRAVRTQPCERPSDPE